MTSDAPDRWESMAQALLGQAPAEPAKPRRTGKTLVHKAKPPQADPDKPPARPARSAYRRVTWGLRP